MIMEQQKLNELEDEVYALHARLSNIISDARRMNERIVEIENMISRLKNILSVSHPAVSNEMSSEDITEIANSAEYHNSDDAVVTKETYTTVLPKPLEIEGFTEIQDIIFYHLKELIHSTSYSTPYRWYDDKLNAIAVALSLVGKELLLIKKDAPEGGKFEEWRKIIETCRKIATYEKKGDKQGYNKYLSFFCEKYPIPNLQFDDDALSLDFFLQNDSVYVDAYQLMYYVNAFKKTIESDYKNCSSDKYWPNYPKHVIFDKIEIDDVLVDYMEMIYMLRYEHNFTIAIIPVLDENIIYRPKREAQDGTYYSLFYYDDYVEEPTMEFEEKDEASTSIYHFSGGSTFVKGHYRSGYWRNGRYVSGGYVKGHYRS